MYIIQEEYMNKIELKRKFYVESVEEKKEMIRKLENEELK